MFRCFQRRESEKVERMGRIAKCASPHNAKFDIGWYGANVDAALDGAARICIDGVPVSKGCDAMKKIKSSTSLAEGWHEGHRRRARASCTWEIGGPRRAGSWRKLQSPRLARRGRPISWLVSVAQVDYLCARCPLCRLGWQGRLSHLPGLCEQSTRLCRSRSRWGSSLSRSELC